MTALLWEPVGARGTHAWPIEIARVHSHVLTASWVPSHLPFTEEMLHSTCQSLVRAACDPFPEDFRRTGDCALGFAARCRRSNDRDPCAYRMCVYPR